MLTGWGHPSDWLVWPPEFIGLCMVQRQTHLFPTFFADASWMHSPMSHIPLHCPVHSNHFIVQFIPPIYDTIREKWCQRSVLILFFFNFHLWPRVTLAESISKNASSVTDEYPWVILKTSIRSARTRRSSSDHSFNFASRSSYGIFFKSGIIFVNLLWILSMRTLSFT